VDLVELGVAERLREIDAWISAPSAYDRGLTVIGISIIAICSIW